MVAVAFLSRHGLHHELAPHEVPARANVAALRSIGVRTIIAFSAVGSLQEEIKPRDFVIPDQVIDRTKGVRPWTFFDGGVVGHVPFADPFDEGVAKVVRACGHSLEGDGVKLHDRGTLICMGMYNIGTYMVTPPVMGTRLIFFLVQQRVPNSRLALRVTSIAPGVVALLTCPVCPRRSWLARPKSPTR